MVLQLLLLLFKFIGVVDNVFTAIAKAMTVEYRYNEMIGQQKKFVLPRFFITILRGFMK